MNTTQSVVFIIGYAILLILVIITILGIAGRK